MDRRNFLKTVAIIASSAAMAPTLAFEQACDPNKKYDIALALYDAIVAEYMYARTLPPVKTWYTFPGRTDYISKQYSTDKLEVLLPEFYTFILENFPPPKNIKEEHDAINIIFNPLDGKTQLEKCKLIDPKYLDTVWPVAVSGMLLSTYKIFNLTKYGPFKEYITRYKRVILGGPTEPYSEPV